MFSISSVNSVSTTSSACITPVSGTGRGLRLKSGLFLAIVILFDRHEPPDGADGDGAVGAPTGAGRRVERDMSQHSSLKSTNKIVAKRNVLKRFERVEILKKRGQWKDGDRGFGLRKTKAEA